MFRYVYVMDRNSLNSGNYHRGLRMEELRLINHLKKTGIGKIASIKYQMPFYLNYNNETNEVYSQASNLHSLCGNKNEIQLKKGSTWGL